ncbi:MAG TPA: IS1595 family transposase [Xanthobacteraceae bacterium]|nr:IS1595 family transposase [Xanthobacteraceae bacterium]
MGKNTFADPIFHDETAAREWFEKTRWPFGPTCPKCNTTERKPYATKKAGVYRCGAPGCRKDFTVMTGTVMERSHAKLIQWAVAFHMAASSKKGFSAHQLHRELGCQYNTAWFLHHRVMEAMRRGGLDLPPMGGEGKVVEADETYFGNIPEAKRPKFKTTGRPFSKNGRGPTHKRAIISLVERRGEVRSFHVPSAHAGEVVSIVRNNIARESRLHTDESKLYHGVGKEFSAHETVNHSIKEYARGDVTTNTVESYFSVFKRGMRGVYQHCAEKHLHRYLAEFDFRYNYRASLGYNDAERTIAAVRGGEGKRLTYHQSH